MKTKIAFMFAGITLLIAVSVSAQTLPPGEMVDVPWYGEGCQVAHVSSCSVGDGGITVYLYANGVRLGACGGTDYAPFYSRGLYTDTITLVNSSYVSETSVTALSVVCDSAIASSESIDPTPTPDLMTPPPTPNVAYVQSGGAFPLPSFGGSLNNPNSPVNLWLGFAQDTIDLVNGGNLLYIMGAIIGAGLVLSWAIDQVKNPKSW